MEDLDDKIHLILIIAGGLLLIGIADLPIGYYTFIRFTTSIAAGLFIYYNREKGFETSNIVYGAILLFFNPIYRVYLHDKAAWMIIDLVVGLIFIVHGYQLYKSSKKNESK